MTKYKVADNMEDAFALAVNAGMDMSMIPLDAERVHDGRMNCGTSRTATIAVSSGIDRGRSRRGS